MEMVVDAGVDAGVVDAAHIGSQMIGSQNIGSQKIGSQKIGSQKSDDKISSKPMFGGLLQLLIEIASHGEFNPNQHLNEPNVVTQST